MTPLQEAALRISELKAAVDDEQRFEEETSQRSENLALLKELLRVDRALFVQGTTSEERIAAMKWVSSYLDAEHSSSVPADRILFQLMRRSK
jgi:hypothetical protein